MGTWYDWLIIWTVISFALGIFIGNIIAKAKKGW